MAQRPADRIGPGGRPITPTTPGAYSSVEHDDARDVGVQASPMPWTRYFFPKEVGAEKEGPSNPFFQYFDVYAAPMTESEQVYQPPPEWTPDAFFRLSFVQMHQGGNPEDHIKSKDITNGGAALYGESAANKSNVEEVVSFCRRVSSFKARSWQDADPLIDLLRGLLMYVCSQLADAKKAAESAARASLSSILEEEREKIRSELESHFKLEKQKLQAEFDARLDSEKEAQKKQLEEDFGRLLRQRQAEAEDWEHMANQTSELTQRQEEDIKQLRATVEELRSALDGQTTNSADHLKAKEAELVAALTKGKRLEAQVTSLRKSVVDAFKAKSKEEVMGALVAAVSDTSPGRPVHTYIAELKSSVNAAAVDEHQEPDRHLELQGAFLHSPLTAPLGAPRTTSGDEEDEGEKPPPVELDKLYFKYIMADASSKQLLDKSLPYGAGVSWQLLTGSQQVFVTDAARDPTVHFFGSSRNGSYYAEPIIGRSGEVVGMIGCDTLAAASGDDESCAPLSEEERFYIHQLTLVLTQMVVAEQESIAALIKQEEEDEGDEKLPDASEVADLEGGMKLWREALTQLAGLSDEDLLHFQHNSETNDVAWAILKAILTLTGDLGECDWDTMRNKVTRDLITHLTQMDPAESWAEWRKICKDTKDVGLLDPASLEGEQSPTKAIFKFIMAARKISAARLMQQRAEEALRRSNLALIRAFTGDGASALAELKSYRVPSPHTLKVLECVLLALGHKGEDVKEWSRMRVLVSYKLVKKLTSLHPGGCAKDVFRRIKDVVEGMERGAVKDESVATLILFNWLTSYITAGNMGKPLTWGKGSKTAKR